VQAYIESNLFADGLNKILSVIDKKNINPILQYTQININNTNIELSATDTIVSAKVILPAEATANGTFCVNAKNLFDILKELPNTKIQLDLNLEENILKIVCNDIRYSLLIYKNSEYPHLIFSNNEGSFSLESNIIYEMIQKTQNSISTDETRSFLNGIFFQEMNSKLRAVATDGNRLSLYETSFNHPQNDHLINGFILPKKGVYELKKVAETYPNKEIIFNVDDSFLYVNADDNYYLSIRLIAKEYPKYQSIISVKSNNTLTVEKDLFLDSLRRIKIMANEKSNGVRVYLTEREMTLTANHPSLGDASEKIAIEYNGKPIEIGFNARYLMDILTVLNTSEVSLDFNNELSPVAIKSLSLPQFLGIIMPLKL